MITTPNSAILLFSCPDRAGLVSRLTHFIFERGGNIMDLDEHVSDDENIFTARISWQMDNFSISAEDLDDAIRPLAKEFKADWKIHFSENLPRVAIFVSKYDHCLQDILWRYKAGELNCEIKLIISNRKGYWSSSLIYKIA